jgi:dTDP-4-dehydrorhamnose 3,5-epimerase
MATTEFKIKQTEIPGLLEIEITKLEDPRGWFQEKFQQQKLVDQGFPANFLPVQQNISFNKEVGVTRGIHAEPWEKYIGVITGKIHAVYVDLRKDNFGKKVEIVVDENRAVFIPRGVANSFQTLTANTFYSYLVNDHWAEGQDDNYKFINLSDPVLAINWPIALDKAIISEKDKNHPMLSDIKPFDFS